MGLREACNQIRETLAIKFVKDTVWILSANVALGVFGFLTNVVLVTYYGADGLGHFMLAFSVYLLLHVISVMGTNSSVIKYTAERAEDGSHVAGVLTAGALLAAALSVPVALAGWAGTSLVALVYEAPAVVAIYRVFLVGLPLFAVNKVLAGLLNGLRDMKAYAVAQAARYVLVFAGIVALHAGGASLHQCAWAVPASEALLLVGLLWRTALPKRWRLTEAGAWVRRHLRFGFYSCLHDFAGELYFRIDILVVGFFAEPLMLGLYVFASDVAKGLIAFSTLVQINLNPIISKLWASRDVLALRDYMRRVRKATYLMYVPVVVCAAVAYPVFVVLFRSEMIVRQHFGAFYVLLAGTFVLSGYSAMLGVMAFTGHLGTQMRRSVYALLTNTVGSLILVPAVGIMGAAMSTLATFLVLVGYTHHFIKARLEIVL